MMESSFPQQRTKQEWRAVFREQAKRPEWNKTLAEDSERICQQFVSWLRKDHEPKAMIASFYPLEDEVDLRSLHQLLPKCQFVYPVLREDRGLDFHLVSDVRSLKKGSLGVYEPQPLVHPLVRLEDIEIVILPGMAFDLMSGARLGKGLGCYDRTLSALEGNTVSLVGVARPCQMVSLPIPEEHDVLLRDLITPHKHYSMPHQVPYSSGMGQGEEPLKENLMKKPMLMRTKKDIQDLYFMKARYQVLEIASYLDRVERHPGEEDFRQEALRKSLEVLGSPPEGMTRTQAVHHIFSDQSKSPVKQALTSVACGAMPLPSSAPNEGENV